MARTLFRAGARGGIVRSIQVQLKQGGHYTNKLDGDYGPKTEQAVSRFQQEANQTITGSIEDTTWTALMKAPIPSIFERALQLTASFEGHGFGLAQGNWDGAWLTWGIIGFTLKHGEVQQLLREIAAAKPGLLSAAFGAHAPELQTILASSRPQQEAWANSITQGTRLVEPWQSGFQQLGDDPIVQQIQLDRARTQYFNPARQTAAAFDLTSELGLALCFDIHVQNGSIGTEARAQIRSQEKPDEPSRRIVIANAVADHALLAFRNDVRARKLTIATGAGMVHGGQFVLANWGLGEFPAAASAGPNP